MMRLVDALEKPLPSEMAGLITGTTLRQVDSSSALPVVAQCAASCIAGLCSDPIDSLSCSTTAIKLDGVPRLRQLVGLHVVAGGELPSTERSDEVRAAALRALDSISIGRKLLCKWTPSPVGSAHTLSPALPRIPSQSLTV